MASNSLDLVNQTSTTIPLKITVLGDSKVGKTSFIQSLNNNLSEEINLNHPFTEVIVRDFKTNTQIAFQFTDNH